MKSIFRSSSLTESTPKAAIGVNKGKENDDDNMAHGGISTFLSKVVFVGLNVPFVKYDFDHFERSSPFALIISTKEISATLAKFGVVNYPQVIQIRIMTNEDFVSTINNRSFRDLVAVKLSALINQKTIKLEVSNITYSFSRDTFRISIDSPMGDKLIKIINMSGDKVTSDYLIELPFDIDKKLFTKINFARMNKIESVDIIFRSNELEYYDGVSE